MKNILSFLFLLFSISAMAQVPVAQVTVTGKGEPILFIPHIGCPPAMWKETVDELSKNNSCHQFALAGFAGMSPIAGDYTKQYLHFIEQYIQSQKIKKATLVGMNYGGFLALQLANHSAISKVVVIDTYPFLAHVLNPKATQQEAETYAAQMQAGYLAPNEKDFEAMMYQNAKAMITNDTVKAKTYAQWVVSSNRQTIASTLADQMKTDLRPTLPSIKTPVLIVSTWFFGKTYKNMPLEEGYRMHEELYASLPNRSIRLTETAKDFMHWDEPAWFMNELKLFMAW